jgi:hypothetical protein
MSFMIGRSESISNASFSSLRWRLSVLSIVLTSGFVALLEVFS